jgi:hypothetical protein
MTFITEVSAALVVAVRRKEGAIGGEDLKGEEPEEADDLNQDMSDLGIAFFSQAIFEMSEIGFTGNMRGRDPSIEAIMSSLLLVSDDGEKSFQIRELFQISEEFQEKEADGIIGMSSRKRIG